MRKQQERHVTKSVTTYQCGCGCGCKTDCGCKKKKKSCGCKKPCGCEPEVNGCDPYIRLECVVDKDGGYLVEIIGAMQAEILALQKANLVLTQTIANLDTDTSTTTPVLNEICVVENTIQLKSDGEVVSSATLPITTTSQATYTLCEREGDIVLKQDDVVISTIPLELIFASGVLFLTSDGEPIASTPIPTTDSSNLNLECNTIGADNYLQLTYNGTPIGTQDLAGNEGLQFITMFQKLLQTSDAGCEILRLIDGINPDDCN